MYNADRRSKEFIDGLHYFLFVAEINKQNGFICYPCVNCKNNARVLIARITRITPFQESYTATFSQMVSWRSMFVGRSTENRGLPWKTIKKNILTTTFPRMLDSGLETTEGHRHIRERGS